MTGSTLRGRSLPRVESGRSRAAPLAARGIRTSSVGSPIGKIAITEDFEPHLARFSRALHVAGVLGAPYIRLFSFFMPAGDDPAWHRDEVLRRMTALVTAAKGHDVVLLHEN